MKNIDRYFAKNLAVRASWQLLRGRGPQNLEDRRNAGKLDYLGSPRRFKFFSAWIFRHKLKAFRPAAELASISKSELMTVLQATSTRAANRAVVRNYAVPFSGSQCYCQRASSSLFQQEPRAMGVGLPLRAGDFVWLQCSDCRKWRRVDLPAGRLFDAQVWRQKSQAERRRSLLSTWPSLLPFLHEWWEVAEVDKAAVCLHLFQSLLQENGFAELLDADNEASLLELLDEFLLHYGCASVDISDRLVEHRNAQGGAQFVCADLSNCACSDVGDWDVRSCPID